ncbi:MAG TPA: glycosyltransferase [Candidatus Binataceae bacterium]|nr:glycosyltransferase [Candidatus Binataceae bacterium]
MRLLHVHSGNLYGGVETLLTTLARHRKLAPLEHEAALCFESRLAQELCAVGVAIYMLGAARVRNPLTLRRARERLRELLARRRFDAVACHSAWATALFAGVVKAARLPLIFWVHGAATGRHWLDRWASVTQPDLLLCNSAFTASTMTALYPRAPREVLYLPVAPAPPLDVLARSAIREQFGAPDDAIVIAQASRLEETKGHLVLIEALALLANLAGWRCWIIGGPQRPGELKYFARLKARTTELGIAQRVTFCGEQPQAARLLAAADIYCQPHSAAEGFGLAFAEAMSAGLPVISTGLGGVAELIDESCAITVPPNDFAAVATALRALIDDPWRRNRLGASGAQRARLLCDPRAQMVRLAAIVAALSGASAASARVSL